MNIKERLRSLKGKGGQEEDKGKVEKYILESYYSSTYRAGILTIFHELDDACREGRQGEDKERTGG